MNREADVICASRRLISYLEWADLIYLFNFFFTRHLLQSKKKEKQKKKTKVCMWVMSERSDNCGFFSVSHLRSFLRAVLA